MNDQERLFTPSPEKNRLENPALGNDAATAKKESYFLRSPPPPLPRLRSRYREESPTERLSERNNSVPTRPDLGMFGNDRKISAASMTENYQEAKAKYERDLAAYEADEQQHQAEVRKCQQAAEGYGHEAAKLQADLEQMHEQLEEQEESLIELKGRFWALHEQMEYINHKISLANTEADELVASKSADEEKMEKLDRELREANKKASQEAREAAGRVEYLERKKAALDTRKAVLDGWERSIS